MGYSEFLEIIQGNDKDYIINPAHCSKFSVNLDDLPEDDNFRDFVTMLNGINWETACEIIYKKVQNEEKFIGFLLKQTPETSRDDIKKNFEIHFNNYLKNQNKNKNDFLKEWTIEQMSCLVNHLTGTTLIKGKQRELNIAISDSKKILAYLKSDLSDLSDVEKSDLLLKLSVEAGDYCARGVSKVTQEIMSEIIIPSIEGKAGEIQTDRIKEYEIKIKTILENHRKELIEQIYGEMQSMQIIPKAISEDVHGFDIYRNMLCLGFYPMTRTERYEVRLDEIFQWSKIWRPIRKAQGEIPYRNNMYDQIKDNNLESLQYILLVIGKSENLSDKEKTNLESILSCSSDTIKINSDNYYPTINRLMLVMMGVLKKNPHLNSVEIPLQNPLPNLEDSDDEDNLL
jgi:hypothetical protein